MEYIMNSKKQIMIVDGNDVRATTLSQIFGLRKLCRELGHKVPTITFIPNALIPAYQPFGTNNVPGAY